MSTKHPDLFAALAAPFESHELKVRSQQGRQLHYITARTAMNRLDNVLGPENWEDDYTPFGTDGVKCVLRITLPDGRTFSKSGLGGITEMHDASDNDKSGESDALKRAAVKLGVARYLYRDGVPTFAQEHAPSCEGPDVARDARADKSEHRPHANGATANGNGKQRHEWAGAKGADVATAPRPRAEGDAPRTGKALFAWTKDQEQRHEVALLKYLNGWAKLQEFPGRMVDWDAEQVRQGHAEALRKLGEHPGDQHDYIRD